MNSSVDPSPYIETSLPSRFHGTPALRRKISRFFPASVPSLSMLTTSSGYLGTCEIRKQCQCVRSFVEVDFHERVETFLSYPSDRKCFACLACSLNKQSPVVVKEEITYVSFFLVIIALILCIAFRLQICKKYVNSTMERQIITLFQHFPLDLLHFSDTIRLYF